MIIDRGLIVLSTTSLTAAEVGESKVGPLGADEGRREMAPLLAQACSAAAQVGDRNWNWDKESYVRLSHLVACLSNPLGALRHCNPNPSKSSKPES
jgi:hypothetical protein